MASCEGGPNNRGPAQRWAAKEMIRPRGVILPNGELGFSLDLGQEAIRAESRHLGVIVVLARKVDKRVLLVEDEGKIEEVAGVKGGYYQGDALCNRVSFPSGGAMRGENIVEVIEREMEEELGIRFTQLNSRVVLLSKQNGVANQVREGESVDQFAAWVVGIDLNEQEVEYVEQRLIEQQHYFYWIEPRELVAIDVWGSENLQDQATSENTRLFVRPASLLVAQMLYYGFYEDILATVNREARVRGYQQADRLGLSLNNGVVGEDGRVAPESEEMVREFLRPLLKI